MPLLCGNGAMLMRPSEYLASLFSDNPVAVWILGETGSPSDGVAAIDQMGSHPGTYESTSGTNGPTLGQSSLVALDSNTSADWPNPATGDPRVNIPANAALAPASYTIECVFSPLNTGTIDGCVFGGDTLANRDMRALVLWDRIRLRSPDGLGTTNIDSATISGGFLAGTSYHAAYRYNSSTEVASVYWNGANSGVTGSVEYTPVTGNDRYIGRMVGSNELFQLKDARLQYVALFNYVVATSRFAERTTIMQTGSP